jgi:hypothetical protein
LKLGDFVKRVTIDPRKLTEYALNPHNPVGGDKAIVFEGRLGFTKENYEPLLQQLHDLALDAEATPGIHDQYGQRYTVDIEVIGAEGRKATVRTGWIVRPGSSDVAGLVTLYVR